jgi:octanoyl-[GcvH]:protein N-octanoyltransferase
MTADVLTPAEAARPATGAFGDEPVQLLLDAAPRPEPSTPEQDVARSAAALAALAQPGAGGLLRVHRPRPTAAFSRRDSLAAGFPAAATAARERGFTPVVRPVGGRLAIYHTGSVVFDLVARHPDPRGSYRERFRLVGDLLAGAMGTLGVDARVGPVPGEYCPGEFSVNAGGVTKLVGTAQRLTAHGYLFSAVVLVSDAEPVRAALARTYPLLGLDCRPETAGCVADHAPGVTVDDVISALRPALSMLLRPAR